MAGLDRITGLESQTNSGLQSQKDGVIYEQSTEKRAEYKTLEQARKEVALEEAEAAKANLHSRFDGPGVAVELSTEAVKASETAKERNRESSILDIFRDTWKQFVQFIQAVWQGGSEATANSDNKLDDSIKIENISDNEGDTTIGATQEDLVQLDNSPENITSFMVDYGGRKLAKNSDLLTQYDRTGKIVGPNPSDRRRILQGEGKVRHY